MLLTTTETVAILEIQWDKDPDIGYTRTKTSVHPDKQTAEKRMENLLREIAGTASYETLAIAQSEESTYADILAGTEQISYSIVQRRVER